MSILGTRVVRIEDPRLLTEGGRYVDDVAPADALFLTFVRSEFAHARLGAVDTAEAVAAPGVVGVYTAADLGLEPRSPGHPMLNAELRRSSLATDRVRYVGEPYAVVVSRSRAEGVDAAELVAADFEPLPVVTDPRRALAGEVEVFDAGNVTFAIPENAPLEGFFDDCEVTTSLSFVNQRVAPCPLETRAVVSVWNDGRLTQWSSTQGAHGTKSSLMAALGLGSDDLRIITPDVGGGFGAKNGGYPEDIVAALVARLLDAPVRWSETRSESMLGLVHGRGQWFDATIGGTADGRITHYSLDVVQDAGGYAEMGSLLPFATRLMTSGTYDIANVRFSSKSVCTNTVPIGAYRGAGRPEAAAAIERMVDRFAAVTELDPIEVRRQNYLAPTAFPLTTPTGAAMDCGDYAGSLDRALDAADIAELRASQQRRRAEKNPKLLGIGIATYVEITNPLSNADFGSVRIQTDGSAVALTGQSPHGQGHETSFAMLVSEQTGIPLDRIEVRYGDTDEVARGAGTGGSKSLQIGGTAIWNATAEVIDVARDLAAKLLEANPDDVKLDTESASFSVVGTPSISVGWADVAIEAEAQNQVLEAAVDFQPDGATFPFGTHVAVVEVDAETGQVELLRHVACDDAGRILNPLIVDGQVHGGLAQGIAQALYEEFTFDPDGNPITANFMDYGFGAASEFPSFERVPMETPTPLNPLGAKGVGESGTIGATPAVHNAVCDAVSHLGIDHIDLPLTPLRVWSALNPA